MGGVNAPPKFGVISTRLFTLFQPFSWIPPLKLIGAMISIEGEYNLRPGATLKIISGAHRPYFEHEIVVLGNKISRITYFKWLRGFFPRVFSIARQQRRAKRVPRTPPFCTELCCEFSLSRQFFDG